MSRKVAIYARVSTEHEAQLSALENQVQYYDELLQKHPDFELYDRYIDEGITGTSTRKRPSFLRMMEDAKKGCFSLIITREVSRFARNTVDALQETRKLKSMGVEVWFTEDNIWTLDDSDGELRLTIMATLAQNESKKTSVRIKAGNKISYLNAVPFGSGNILGYDKLPGHHGQFVINKEQAETVRLIYDLFLSGKGLRAIQWELENRGRKTATGLTKWDCSQIGRTLKNPFYCGIIVYRKSYVPDFLEQKCVKNNGQVEKVTVKGKHEPIVTVDEYNRVMERFEQRVQMTEKNGKTIGYKVPANIWGRKLVCSCGKKYRRQEYYVSKAGKTTYCYQCGGQLNKGSYKTRLKKGLSVEGICRSQFVQEWKLEVQAAKVFSQFFNSKDKVLKLANEMFLSKRYLIGRNQAKEKEIERLNEDIEKTKALIDKLLDIRLANEIGPEEYYKKRADLDSRVNDSRKKMEMLSNTQDEDGNFEERIAKMKEVLESKKDIDLTRFRDDLIEEFVKKIVVFEDRFEWHMRFGGRYDAINIGDSRNPDVKFNFQTGNVRGRMTGSNQAQKVIRHNN